MQYCFSMLENEHWWGGTVASGACPLTAASEYHQDFRVSCDSQTVSMFLSNLGRCIWSENPFKVDVLNGLFLMEGEDITLETIGSNLREAYREAQKRYFPCDGKRLPEAFFQTAQYNTWMEFTYYPTQEGVLTFAKEWLNHGYPPGIFIIDEGWHGRYGVWEFDFGRFPDPKGMVDQLHEMGFIVLLWVTPFVCPDGPDFVRSLGSLEGTDPEMAKNLYMRRAEAKESDPEDLKVALTRWWNGYSAILNLDNPWDARFLDNKLQHLIKEYGVDGFKFDGGTPDVYHSGNVINGTFACKLTPHELNQAWNRFGCRYTYHEYKDTYKRGGKNCIQRLRDKHPTWEGTGINLLIPCAITCGLIGHPFVCPDMVGGGEWTYRFLPGFEMDEELFVRMAQCSAMFPMIQFSWSPWSCLNEENQKHVVAAANLHQELADEILELVHEAEKTGEPILRTLEYNDPHKGYAGITDEFMLGEKILAAPVVTKGTFERKVVFPQGRWQDAEGRVYEGGTSEVLPAPLDKLLWFRKIS